MVTYPTDRPMGETVDDVTAIVDSMSDESIYKLARALHNINTDHQEYLWEEMWR